MDLALGVDKDAAIEHYETAYTEDGGCEELDGKFVFHLCEFLKFFANICRFRGVLLVKNDQKCILGWFFAENGQNFANSFLGEIKFRTEFGV